MGVVQPRRLTEGRVGTGGVQPRPRLWLRLLQQRQWQRQQLTLAMRGRRIFRPRRRGMAALARHKLPLQQWLQPQQRR